MGKTQEQLQKEWNDREKWFQDRIGKRVYRNSNGCPCKTCQRVTNDGLIIGDKTHASYLHEWEGMPDSDIVIRYFDTKEERDAFNAQ